MTKLPADAIAPASSCSCGGDSDSRWRTQHQYKTVSSHREQVKLAEQRDFVLLEIPDQESCSQRAAAALRPETLLSPCKYARSLRTELERARSLRNDDVDLLGWLQEQVFFDHLSETSVSR